MNPFPAEICAKHRRERGSFYENLLENYKKSFNKISNFGRHMEYKFSEKHIAYMRRARNSVMNVAEGAVRAGKTIDNVFVFAELLETSPDKLHLATGSTASNARLNLGDCNGLGLEHIFRGRSRWGKYQGSEALTVFTATGEKTVLFAGGKNADSFKRIRGLSIGMWIATEINLHHETMIREAFSRQLAAQDRRIFWDLNPDAPGAMIYSAYIDRYATLSANGALPPEFYNWEHFTIFDNETVSGARLAEILAQYEVGSLWYRRDILGERCAAEGTIYTRFANDPASFTVKREALPPFSFLTVGLDFGGNKSRTAMVACGMTAGFTRLYAVDEECVAGDVCEIDAECVNEACYRFLCRLHGAYPGVPIRYVFCDNEEQYLIAGLRKFLHRKLTRGECPWLAGVAVKNARKYPINERIACETALFASGRLYLTADCAMLAAGLSGALWDTASEKTVRLDNFTSDIDILDAFEYAFEGYIPKFA